MFGSKFRYFIIIAVISFATSASARDYFHKNIRNSQPTIEINLGALNQLSRDYSSYGMPRSKPVISRSKVVAPKGREQSPRLAKPVKKPVVKKVAKKPAPAPKLPIPEMPKPPMKAVPQIPPAIPPAPVAITPAPIQPIAPQPLGAPKIDMNAGTESLQSLDLAPPPIPTNPPAIPKLDFAPKNPTPAAPTKSSEDLLTPPPPPADLPKVPAIPTPVKEDEDSIAIPALPEVGDNPAPVAPLSPPPLPPVPAANGNTLVLPSPSRALEPPALPPLGAAPSANELPPINNLFGDSPTPAAPAPIAPLAPPPAPVAAPQVDQGSQIGKPEIETVMLQPQKLPELPSFNVTPGKPALSINFREAETEIPVSEQAQLIGIAQNLKADSSKSVQIFAYASGTEEQTSQAKRTSLGRALSARRYFTEQGIDSSRIELKALGNNASSGVPDRVDIVIK